MRRKGHATLGLITGALTAALPYLIDSVALTMDKTNPAADIVIGGFVAVFAASIPDWLEPSKKSGPNHRSFFHSWVVLIALACIALAVYTARIAVSQDLTWCMVLPAIAGYLSHLLSDMMSPKGLPGIWLCP